MTDSMESDPGSQQFIAANSPIPRMGELRELDGALFLDPDNPVLKGMRDMMQDTELAAGSFELKRQRDLEVAGQTLQNIEATTPFDDILTYPGDWPELTAGRLSGLEDQSRAQPYGARTARYGGSCLERPLDSTGRS